MEPASLSGAFVTLASAGDGLARDLRLGRLRHALASQGATMAEVEELDRLRTAARPDALRQAEALAVFFDSYRRELEELAATAAARGLTVPPTVAATFATRGRDHARAVVDAERRAPSDDDDDPCDAYGALVMEEYTEYIAGHGDEHLVYADVWIALGKEAGCTGL